MQRGTASNIEPAEERQATAGAEVETTLGVTESVTAAGFRAAWGPAPAEGGAPGWRAFPADLAYGSAVRHAIQGAATERLIPPDDTADLVLAVSEAFNNAVRHGNCRPEDCVWVTARWDPAEVTIELRYRGEPFPAEEPSLPPASSPRGRGRYIMNRLMDAVEYRFDAPWTELRMLRRFRWERVTPPRG
jgi:anti-sigma regulatory factor (Ser/Thr protein kinase)